MLSDKQHALLMEIYPRMMNEAGKIVEKGLHREAFNTVNHEICFEQSVDYWTRELINVYNNDIRNISISEEVIDGHLVDYLEGIESKDLKVYASIWEVNNNGKIVYTNDVMIPYLWYPHSTSVPSQ